MDIKKDFDTAFKDHQKGNFVNAEVLYKKILNFIFKLFEIFYIKL